VDSSGGPHSGGHSSLVDTCPQLHFTFRLHAMPTSLPTTITVTHTRFLLNRRYRFGPTPCGAGWAERHTPSPAPWAFTRPPPCLYARLPGPAIAGYRTRAATFPNHPQDRHWTVSLVAAYRWVTAHPPTNVDLMDGQLPVSSPAFFPNLVPHYRTDWLAGA